MHCSRIRDHHDTVDRGHEFEPQPTAVTVPPLAPAQAMLSSQCSYPCNAPDIAHFAPCRRFCLFKGPHSAAWHRCGNVAPPPPKQPPPRPQVQVQPPPPPFDGVADVSEAAQKTKDEGPSRSRVTRASERPPAGSNWYARLGF